MHKTKLVLLTAAALLAITSGAEAAKVKRSSGFSMGRGKAAGLISSGKVELNHRPCVKPDRAVEQGDVITCRGLGKCLLKEMGGVSKKGRIMLVLERYV